MVIKNENRRKIIASGRTNKQPLERKRKKKLFTGFYVFDVGRGDKNILIDDENYVQMGCYLALFVIGLDESEIRCRLLVTCWLYLGELLFSIKV